MHEVTFDDLLDIRKGGENLTLGSGPSRIERISTGEEWEVKARALREIFLQTLGQAPDIACPLSPEGIEEIDCGEYVWRRIEYSLEPDETAHLFEHIKADAQLFRKKSK